MVRCMKDNVGLVHQMPYICDRTGFPSILEKVSFLVTVTFEQLATVCCKFRLLRLAQANRHPEPSVVDRHRFDNEPVPDPTFYIDDNPDPDPTPSFTHVKEKNLKFFLTFQVNADRFRMQDFDDHTAEKLNDNFFITYCNLHIQRFKT